jgi:hypothetical protein
MFYIIFATYYNVFYIMYGMGFITIIYYYYKTHIIMYFILCIVCVSKVKIIITIQKYNHLILSSQNGSKNMLKIGLIVLQIKIILN